MAAIALTHVVSTGGDLRAWLQTAAAQEAPAHEYDRPLALAVHLSRTDMLPLLLTKAYPNAVCWDDCMEYDPELVRQEDEQGMAHQLPRTSDRLYDRAPDQLAPEEMRRATREAEADIFRKYRPLRVLTKAYEKGSLEMMDHLLTAGASTEHLTQVEDLEEDVPDSIEIGTILYLAAKHGQLPVAQLLIQHGASLTNRYGYYTPQPLYMAVQGDHYDVAKLLIEHGANPDANGMYEVEHALPDLAGIQAIRRSRDTRMLKLLLDHDMDTNLISCTQDEWVGTMLDAALLRTLEPGVRGRVGRAMVKMLLAYNVDWDIQGVTVYGSDGVPLREPPDMSGFFPTVQAAVETARHRQTLAYLQQLPDDELDALDAYGKTALHRAAENGQLAQVQYLLQRGASKEVYDCFGRLPYQSAQHRRDTYLAKRDEKHTDYFIHGDDFFPRAVMDIMAYKVGDLGTIAQLLS